LTITQFAILGVIAIVVTAPVVVFVPRARQSIWFDRVLWLGTLVLSFLAGGYAIGNFNDATSPLESVMIGDVPVLVAVVGAGAGALGLNLVLWLMDRFTPVEIEEEIESIEPGDPSDTEKHGLD